MWQNWLMRNTKTVFFLKFFLLLFLLLLFLLYYFKQIFKQNVLSLWLCWCFSPKLRRNGLEVFQIASGEIFYETNLLSMWMNFLHLYKLVRWLMKALLFWMELLSSCPVYLSIFSTKSWKNSCSHGFFRLSSGFSIFYFYLRARYCLKIDEFYLIRAAKHCKQCKVCT